VGLTIIALAVVGVYMSENEVFELYPIHKSIGVLIFAVIIVRVYWRFANEIIQQVIRLAPYFLISGLIH
jgi:cytochrome b561